MSTQPDLPIAALARSPLTLAPPPGAVAPVRRLSVVPPAPDAGPLGEAEFTEVLRRATPRLVRYAQRRLGNVHEAEEVAQEALLRVVQHRGQLATEDDVLAWATVVTGRLVIDRVRLRARSVAVAEVPERRPAPDTADIVADRADLRTALDALDALPRRQASVVWAREVEGLSYDAIAVRYGLSEPTVRSLLHRGRAGLRRQYALRGGSSTLGVVVGLPVWRALRRALRPRVVGVGLVTAAAVSAVTLGTFGVPAAPASTPPVHGAAVSVAVPQTAPAASAVVAPQAGGAAAPGTPARPAPAAPGAVTPRSVSRPVIAPLPGTCRGVGNGSTAGVNCAPPPRAGTVMVGPALPVTLPDGNRQIAVSTSVLPCGQAPRVPLTACGAGS